MTVGVLALVPVALAAQVGEEGRGGSDEPGVVGQVVDGETRQPLEGVTVRLRWEIDTLARRVETWGATTDARGRFTFRGLPDGRYRLELARAGYGTLVDTVSFRASLGLRVEAELVPEAVEMEPLLAVVEARSRRLEASGFYQRRDRGFGQFVARDEIEDRDPARVTDLLATMRGIWLGPTAGPGDGRSLSMRGGCVPEIFLDGIRTMRPFSLDASLHPDDVAGIEVYHSSELPVQYRVSGCGAVVVWTHVPNADESGDPWSWGRILPFVGVVGAAFLLIR
jgi:hypothetical protein